MGFPTIDPVDAGLALCREAKRLRARSQELIKERLHLLAELKGICSEGQERLAHARHWQACQADREVGGKCGMYTSLRRRPALLDETAVTGDFDGESIEAVVLDMIHRSCVIMPDRASADRLVETVLLRAIAEAKGGQFEGDVRPRLMDMLEEEYRLNSRCFLN